MKKLEVNYGLNGLPKDKNYLFGITLNKSNNKVLIRILIKMMSKNCFMKLDGILMITSKEDLQTSNS
jgi:hypothetical protein